MRLYAPMEHRECPECSGDGRWVCAVCHGDGCGVCDYIGWEQCNRCSGTGDLPQDDYGGQYERYFQEEFV